MRARDVLRRPLRHLPGGGCRTGATAVTAAATGTPAATATASTAVERPNPLCLGQRLRAYSDPESVRRHLNEPG